MVKQGWKVEQALVWLVVFIIQITSGDVRNLTHIFHFPGTYSNTYTQIPAFLGKKQLFG